MYEDILHNVQSCMKQTTSHTEHPVHGATMADESD